MILYDTVTLLIKTKISQKFSIFSSLESYSINRILDDTLYRSSFLRLLLRSIVSDNCMIVSCDEKLSKIVAGVNSQKKLRESRYRSKSVSYRIFTANFRIIFYHPVSSVLENLSDHDKPKFISLLKSSYLQMPCLYQLQLAQLATKTDSVKY